MHGESRTNDALRQVAMKETVSQLPNGPNNPRFIRVNPWL
jgi:hypothetical protein